jgi:predicted transcriptional regulator
MESLPWRASALFVFLLLAVVPSAAVVTGGYSASPAAGSAPGQPQDPVPVSFWDLSPRGMLIALCLSFCPVFVYPVEVFFLFKMMATLGYRKIEKNAILRNRNRQKIYDCIAANPGMKFHALERLTGMKEGTLKYHLLILTMKRRVVSFGTGRSMRYFENNGRYNELEKKVFLHLQNKTTRKILKILASSPEVSRKDIAGIVGVAGPSVSWHTKRLSGDGIITASKKGRAVRYILCPEGADIFRHYLAMHPGMAAGDEPGKQSLQEPVSRK